MRERKETKKISLSSKNQRKEEKWDGWQPFENVWSMGVREGGKEKRKKGRKQRMAGKGGSLKKVIYFLKLWERSG